MKIEINSDTLINIITSTFDIKPKDISLGSEIKKDFWEEEGNKHGSLYSCNNTIQMFSYNPEDGFKPVQSSNQGRSQNADGSWHLETTFTYEDLQKNYEQSKNKPLFYLMIDKSWGWQEGKTPWDYKKYKLFKVPNFHSIEQDFRVKKENEINNWLEN